MSELFRIEHLRKEYADHPLSKKRTVAIEEMNTVIRKEEITALVGESGSGKSTLGMILAGMEHQSSGEIYYLGKNIKELSATGEYRREIQMIFQNPFDSLEPRWSVAKSLIEPIRYHQVVPKGQELTYISEIVHSCGLSDEVLGKRPMQLSGGQLQRICIARILALKPKVLIADEVVTALDAGVQSKILDLLMYMQKTYRFGLIFISHDLAVVRRIADRIIVMKNGRILEEATTKEIFTMPKSEYTKALLQAIPSFEQFSFWQV